MGTARRGSPPTGAIDQRDGLDQLAVALTSVLSVVGQVCVGVGAGAWPNQAWQGGGQQGVAEAVFCFNWVELGWCAARGGYSVGGDHPPPGGDHPPPACAYPTKLGAPPLVWGTSHPTPRTWPAILSRLLRRPAMRLRRDASSTAASRVGGGRCWPMS